jgi:hypothetical protein
MEPSKPIDTLKGVSQRVRASLRTQGEKMVLKPEQTQVKYACPLHRQMRLHLEEVQVLPEVVTPGTEINQRIRYALCSTPPAGSLTGSITRTVRFQGAEMFRDSTDYAFKPGTWVVDVFIGIPKVAGSGVYTLETTLRYGSQMLRKSDAFMVKN